MGRYFTALEKALTIKASSGILQVYVKPAEPIFDHVQLCPGDLVQGSQVITVYNTGNLELYYYIFAAWAPVAPTTPAEAFQAAGKLQAEIIKAGVPPVTIFKAPLLQLYDVPPGGRFLAPAGNEKLYFYLSLPVPLSSFPLNALLKIDFLFVAASS